MKLTVMVPKEIEVTHLKVRAGVRYWEDAQINGVSDEDGSLTPCRVGDDWCPEIELASGRITNWEQGKAADIHFKTADDNDFDLLDSAGNGVSHLDGYVIKMLCPGDGHDYDYIIMKVDENGFIQDWKADLSEFEEV